MLKNPHIHPWLRCVVLLAILIVKKHSVAAEDTGLNDMPCSPREQICPTYMMCCILGEEYCGTSSGTCEKIHWPKVDRLESCCDAIENNQTSHYSLQNACYFLYGLEGLKQKCVSNDDLKEPKDDTCPVAWQIIGFYITLPLSVLLSVVTVVLIVLQKTRKHRKRHRGNRVVTDVERDNKLNMRSTVPLLNGTNRQGNGDNDQTSAFTLGPREQTGPGIQNGPGLIQRQNSNGNPDPQPPVELRSSGLRSIHCEQATDHEWPGGLSPSGKGHKDNE